MKQIAVIVGLCLMPLLSMAQTASSSIPIDLEADSGYFDQLAGRAVYEGNVKVTQGVATIWAHKITIILKNGAAEQIEADGNSKTLVKFIYKGEKQPITGHGARAVYRVEEKTVTLSGDAEVKQGKDVINGKKLTYNLDKEVINGIRVRMTLQPSEK